MSDSPEMSSNRSTAASVHKDSLSSTAALSRTSSSQSAAELPIVLHSDGNRWSRALAEALCGAAGTLFSATAVYPVSCNKHQSSSRNCTTNQQSQAQLAARSDHSIASKLHRNETSMLT